MFSTDSLNKDTVIKLLSLHVCLFQDAIGPDFVSRDDNVRPHRSHVVQELLEGKDIYRTNWPECSPD